MSSIAEALHQRYFDILSRLFSLPLPDKLREEMARAYRAAQSLLGARGLALYLLSPDLADCQTAFNFDLPPDLLRSHLPLKLGALPQLGQIKLQVLQVNDIPIALLAWEGPGLSAKNESALALLSQSCALFLHNLILAYSESSKEALIDSAYEMAQLINDDEVTLEVVLNQVLLEAIKLTGASGAQLMLLGPDQILKVAAELGQVRQLSGYRETINIGEGLMGQVAAQKQAIWAKDYANYTHAFPHVVQQQLIKSVIGMPLRRGDKLLGVLGIFELSSSLPHPLTEDDLEVLEVLAPLAAMAVDKAQLRSQLRREHSQLQTILHHIPLPIWSFDHRWRLTMGNPEAYHLAEQFDLNLDNFLGKSYNRLLRAMPQSVKLPRAAFGEAFEISFGEQGDYFFLIAEIRRDPQQSEADGYVVVAQSVTAERELHRIRRELLHIISHDLGNILSLALGYAGLMMEEEYSGENYRVFIRRIFEALNRAKSLIRDVVELEHAKTQGLQISKPYSLEEALYQVTSLLVGSAELRKQSLEYQVLCPPLPALMGNVSLIKQAVENLVSNAIKYTPEAGRISIRLDRDETHAILHIQDSGIGIPAEDLPKIWGRFYRVESEATRNIQGRGLGLSLVAWVVELHQGRIEAESQVGVGSTFHLYLPFEVIPPAESA
jgi:signal transduction histidine kinase